MLAPDDKVCSILVRFCYCLFNDHKIVLF